MKKRFFVIDGHALCYRAHYSFINNPLINSKGQNTSVIFGFARMLFRLISDQKPDYLVVAFDPPRKTFRFRLYPEYKANRLKMPEDMRYQIEEIKNMLQALGITQIEDPDHEADDVLGSIAKRYSRNDIEVILVTGDKDAYQLVDDNVKIYANTKGITEYEELDAASVMDKLGIYPCQVVDYMALMGDSSDNIPGVMGVGKKNAQKLISEFGTLECIYEHIDDIKGKKIKESILRDKEMAFLSRELVTIKTDLDFKVEIEKTKLREFDAIRTKDFFNRLEMRSILKELFPDDESILSEKKERKKDYKIIRTEQELKKAIALIKTKGEFSIDTETTSVNPTDTVLVGISLSIKENEGWYIPICGQKYDVNIDKKLSLHLLKPIIENPDIKKIGQNIKFDILVLKNEGIELKGAYFDTMIASYLLDPSVRRHNLDALALKYLEYETISYEDLVGKGKKSLSITDVPLESLSDYAIEDADITYSLYKILKNKIKEEQLEELMYDVEMLLIDILSLMEWNGVKIDLKYFKELSKENQKLLNNVEEKIFQIVGERFNINSTKELSGVLFDKLGLNPVKKTKTGFSTDIRVLEALKGKHEIIDYLISYRTLNKLKSTYTDSLPQLASKKTGRIHTSYNQTVVATGRLSSSNPNLQNIPIRDEFGKKIRKAFIAEEGCLLMSADYSQIELRLAAHLSQDDNMLRAFRDGLDIHNITASSVFQVNDDAVTTDMRRQAKIINFATIYGVSPYGLSQQADISVKEAAEFIKKYFEIYPGFKNYIEEKKAFAREHGYVSTILGRKRPIPAINSENTAIRESAERIAINTPIQGTSADLIKLAMINIQKRICQLNYKSKMILQVHDELVFEVPVSEKSEIETMVKNEMEGAIDLSIPIVVDIGWGKTWADAH
ncbi:MAG: DNA polymerase I [Spirochaetota bacterium]|nr:DNA polymerase I [Spirochaetota bacterium]